MSVPRKLLIVGLIILALVAGVFVVVALQGTAEFLDGQDEIQRAFGD